MASLAPLPALLALLALGLPTAAAGAAPAPRTTLNFDFAWRHTLTPDAPPVPPCPSPSPFTNASGVQCGGLQPAHSATTAEQCQSVCCADPECDVWQFTTAGGQGCWYGRCESPNNHNLDWVGGNRSRPYTPGPPPPPQATGPLSPGYDDAGWALVDAPHDALINNTHDPGNAWSGRSHLVRNNSYYRKHFRLPATAKGQAALLYFEGVFREAFVYINGEFVVHHACGYTSFAVRLDNVSGIHYGDAENVVAMYVESVAGSGWWYEGGGLYRHVRLELNSPVHVDVHGLFAATSLPGNATQGITHRARPALGSVAAAAQVDPVLNVTNWGGAAATYTATLTVLDATGKAVASMAVPATSVAAGATVEARAQISVPNAELWSIARPYLYTLEASVSVGAVVVDATSVTFGLRTTEFDAATGLHINGQPVKVRGFCNHNDFASVGMGVLDRINLFRAQGMRSVGGNGWRMSHNPPIPALLDIQDRLGITVMDENRLFANTSAYVQNFADLVSRDRNHPSVIIWSFCNEAGCEGKAEDGGPRFQAVARQYDWTRPTLANMFTYGDELGNTIDVQGFSHRPRDIFDQFHAKFPHKAEWASECCSCTTDRDENVNVPGNASRQQSFNAPCVSGQTNASNGVPYVVGQMVWTLFDYYGEPSGDFPHVSSAFGSFDLAGFSKAAVWWYRSWWLNNIPNTDAGKPFATNDTVVHVVENWDAPPPGPAPADLHRLYAVACDGTANQRFTFGGAAGSLGQLRNGDACATACAAQPCVSVPLAPCAAEDPSQLFAYDAATGFLVNNKTGQCLDLFGARGPSVDLYRCNQQSNQVWHITAAGITSGEEPSACLSNSNTSSATVRTVHVYTNAPQVDLMVNGQRQGAQPIGNPSHTADVHSWGEFAVPWTTGSIVGMALDANNSTLATHAVTTSGAPTHILLTLDAPNEATGTGSRLVADGEDAALVRASLVDAKGNVARSASNRVSFRVTSGSARIVGTHNGNPRCLEHNQIPSHAAYHGLVRAVVRSSADASSPTALRRLMRFVDVESGRLGSARIAAVDGNKADHTLSQDIVITASSPGLPDATITIPVSTDPATDSVLAVAERSAKPVVV